MIKPFCKCLSKIVKDKCEHPTEVDAEDICIHCGYYAYYQSITVEEWDKWLTIKGSKKYESAVKSVKYVREADSEKN